MPIDYSSKVNERAIPQAITNEAHVIGIIGVFTVASGLIRLVEVPQGPAPAVTVTGSGGPYTEIISGSPTGGQFLVDYSTGVITFSTTQNGNSILVSYTGLGSEIAAEDINELQIPVGVALNSDGSLSTGIVTTASLSNVIVVPLANLQLLNPSIVPVTNGSGILTSSITTTTELGYVHGVTSNIQTQINALSSGTVSSITGTANEVIASSPTGAVTLSLPQPIATTSSPTFASLTLTSPLTVSNGGTGLATLTAHDVLIGSGTSNVTLVSPSTAGFVLTSNGVSADPTFQAAASTTTVNTFSGAVSIVGTTSEIIINNSSGIITLSTPQAIATTSSPSFQNLTLGSTSLGGLILNDTEGTPKSVTLEAPTTITTSYTLNLPTAQGSSGQTLSNDGSGILSWVTPAGATYTAGTGITLTGSSFSLTSPVSIALGGTNSITTLTNNKVMVSSAGAIVESGTTTTELGFVDATSSIQTQLNSKQTSTLADTNIWVGNSFNTAAAVTLSGDASLSDTGALTLTTVNSNVGSFTNANITVNAKGLITAASDGSASGVATSFQILASDPGSPSAGDCWFNSTDHQYKGFDGTSVIILG